MVKIKHSFKNLRQSPGLEYLVASAKKSVKGLQCAIHPTVDSTVKLRIINNRSMPEYEACCYNFEQVIRQAMINPGQSAS